MFLWISTSIWTLSDDDPWKQCNTTNESIILFPCYLSGFFDVGLSIWRIIWQFYVLRSDTSHMVWLQTVPSTHPMHPRHKALGFGLRSVWHPGDEPQKPIDFLDNLQSLKIGFNSAWSKNSFRFSETSETSRAAWGLWVVRGPHRSVSLIQQKTKVFFFSPVNSWPKLEGSVVQGASAASELLNLWFLSEFRVWVKLCCFICFNSKWWCFWCFWCYWRLKMLPQWRLKCGYHSSSRDDWERVTIFQSRSGSQEQTGVTCGQAWVKSWIPL